MTDHDKENLGDTAGYYITGEEVRRQVRKDCGTTIAPVDLDALEALDQALGSRLDIVALVKFRRAFPALASELRELRERWGHFVGGEMFGDGAMTRRARAISDALGIEDESTTKQLAAIEELRARVAELEETNKELRILSDLLRSRA